MFCTVPTCEFSTGGDVGNTSSTAASHHHQWALETEFPIFSSDTRLMLLVCLALCAHKYIDFIFFPVPLKFSEI